MCSIGSLIVNDSLNQTRALFTAKTKKLKVYFVQNAVFVFFNLSVQNQLRIGLQLSNLSRISMVYIGLINYEVSWKKARTDYKL